MVREILDGHHRAYGIDCLIEGGAHGVDRFACRWAQEHGVPIDPCPVEERDGPWPAAGPRRNSRMLRERAPIHRGIAFIANPPTPGTADMVRKMKRAGIPVREIMLDA